MSGPRTGTIQVRVNDVEKAQIRERALAAGKNVSDYVRDRALGRRARTPGSVAGGAAITPPVPGKPQPADRAPVASNEGAKQEHPPASPTVAAEIEEAKMDDEAAREAFVERRTKQLIGSGRTSIVARREAEAEWRMRGS